MQASCGLAATADLLVCRLEPLYCITTLINIGVKDVDLNLVMDRLSAVHIVAANYLV